MRTTIVLAMHGAPPNDFPAQELGEFFGLDARLEHGGGPERASLERRHSILEDKLRAWPRTAQNDPFYAASQKLAVELGQATSMPVEVGFNEFCAPTLDDALDQAVAHGAEKIVVITPMLTQGGEHAASDIPLAIQRVRERHPGVIMCYAWPFEAADVARFLGAQIARFV